jgi:macrolide transport system ATP-binding/permease protein
MPWVQVIARAWRKLRSLTRRDDDARALDEEMRFHTDLLARDFEAAGLSAGDARDAARRQFGNATHTRERSTDEWRFPALDDLAHDVRFGLRLLKRSPMFAVVAIVAIGMAIGINTGFFTLVDTFMWRPIPVPRSDGLVKMALRYQTRGGSIVFSYPQVQAITRHSRTLSDVLPVGRCVQVAMRSSSTQAAEPARPLCVSGNYFSALGGSAALGRALVPSDDREGAPPAIVISDPFWTRAFARSPDVVGRDVVVNGRHATVVGVIRQDFVGMIPLIPDFWITISTAARLGSAPGQLTDSTNRFIDLRARLAPGVTMAQATADISGIVATANATSQERFDAPRIAGVTLQPNESMLPMTWNTLLIVAPVLLVVALVLVIACANLANLLLSRALARQREIAVRLALGASRARLIRQLLTESLMIALLGSALGFVFSTWTVTLISHGYFGNLPDTFGTIAIELKPSWRVAAYTIGLGLVSVLAFGLAPALHATSASLTSSLKGEDVTFGTRLRRSRLRDALVAVEVAGCVVLLVAAGTLVVSIRTLGTRGVGFEPQRVTVATFGLSAIGRVPPQLDSARTRFASRATMVPGVDITARALYAPYTSWFPLVPIAPEGSTAYRRFQVNAVTPQYFDAVGQRLVGGRAFTTADSASEALVAVVTAAAARALWPASPAVGQTLRVAQPHDAPDKLYRVIGVAADAHAGMIWDYDDDGYVFLPATKQDFATNDMPLLVRSEAPKPVIGRALRDIALGIDPNSPMRAEPAIAARDVMLTPIRYGFWITAGVAAFGLGLALIGLYGVVAFAVAQRRLEIAVHVAMGAASRDVLGLVLRREMRLVLVGLAVGLLLSAAEAQLINAWVLPLTPLSIGGFTAVAAILLVVAGLASMVPALGALRIAPMQVLRQE